MKVIQNRNSRGRRGSVMVEFTLVVPLLVGLFLGAVFFGYDFHLYNRLEEMVRSGGRYASVQRYDAYQDLDPAIPRLGVVPPWKFSVTSGAFLTRVRNVTLYGCEDRTVSPCSTALPIVDELAPEDIAVTLIIRNDVPIAVSVALNNLRMPTPVGPVTFSGKPATGFPYIGSYGPAAPKPGT